MGKLDKPDFWVDFAERYWEREAVLLDGEQTTALPRVSADELLGAVVALVDDFWQGGRQKVRLYVDDQEIDLLAGDYRALLPLARDASFDNYNARVAQEEGLRNYALVIADWHQFDRVLWERILAAVQSLAAVVGISHARMDTQIFLGTYKTTPFGVHVDRTSGFHFPVVGKKTMRFWPGAFAEQTPALRGAMQYEPYIGQSTLRTAQPGQALYWPSSQWHVAESDGQFGVTWGFGYWLGDGMPGQALEELAHMLMASPRYCHVATQAELAAEAHGMHGVDALIDRMGACIADPRFRSALARNWLQHFSACGYLRVPPMLEVPGIEDGDTLLLKTMYTILSTPASAGTMRVAAGGYSETVPDEPAVRDAIAALNAGAELAVARADSAVGRMAAVCLRAGALLRRQSSCGKGET
jgi:hypothetical protein